jgi:Zn-dependent peptidase ImmA (M78 family)
MDEVEVQQRARSFVANIDVSNIRDDLTPYLTAVNAKVVKEELGVGESGYTLTKPNGKHIITVNSLESEERQRFTVCHEVAHIALNLPSSHAEVPSWSFAKRHPNEIVCDTFAAELLMPYQQWLSAVPRGEPSADIIEYMATVFRTSFPAASSRFAYLTDLPCAFVTMEPMFFWMDELDPHLKAYATYYINKFFHLNAGMDDFIDKDFRSGFVGVGLQFEDDDLKYLLSSGGGAVTSAV